MRIINFLLFIFLSISISSNSFALDRYISKLKLPSGLTIVVSEGELEAESTGSFSIRLYQSAKSEDETTFFMNGLVSPGDGFIEKVLLEDVTGNQNPEVIVVVRSVGTGNYISAHTYAILKNQKLEMFHTTEGLMASEDPVILISKHFSDQKNAISK